MSVEATKALREAIGAGDESRVEALLREGANPAPDVPFAELPLVNAIWENSLAMVKALLVAGANVNVEEATSGVTPLILALMERDTEIARCLVEHGAEINVAGDCGDARGRESPLILAAAYFDVDLVRFFLDHGADPNRFGEFHGRPLHRAVDDERTDILELLLDRGANPWFRDDDCDQTALDYALMQEAWKAAAVLYRRIDAQAPGALGTLLHAFAADGAARDVAGRLDLGDPVNARDAMEETPLHWAARGPRRITRLLREAHGFKLCADGNEISATETVKLLLERGADIEAVNHADETPVIAALAWGRSRHEVAQALVLAGADVRRRTNAGWTTVLLAARACAPASLIDLLVQRGADPHSTQGAWNALSYAVHNGGVETARALLSYRVAVNTEGTSPLHIAAWRGRADLVELLLAAGADSAARDSDGKTPYDVTESSEIAARLSLEQ